MRVQWYALYLPVFDNRKTGMFLNFCERTKTISGKNTELYCQCFVIGAKFFGLLYYLKLL